MGKYKIVIADDNRDLRNLLTRRLKHNGYDVYQAEDGQKGVLMVQTEQPDLLIVDLAMPELPGNLVIRILREDPACQDIPIIMLSAFITPGMQENVEVPADCYMSKPFNNVVLMNKVEELIERYRVPKGHVTSC